MPLSGCIAGSPSQRPITDRPWKIRLSFSAVDSPLDITPAFLFTRILGTTVPAAPPLVAIQSVFHWSTPRHSLVLKTGENLFLFRPGKNTIKKYFEVYKKMRQDKIYFGFFVIEKLYDCSLLMDRSTD